MISPAEYCLALASVIAILFFCFARSDAEHADDKGCCLATAVLALAALYLVYFVVRLVHSLT